MRLQDIIGHASFLAIREAHAWLDERRNTPVLPIPKYKRFRVGYRFTTREVSILRQMAKAAVWQERGGLGMGWKGQINQLGAKSQTQMNEEGNGRTTWEGMPEWAKGFDNVSATVEKAIAGGSLGHRQRLLMQVMMEELAESEAGQTDCPF